MPADVLASPLALLERMWLCRAFEEKVSELHAAREISGLLHLGIGQEAVAVGAAAALSAGDLVYGGHRAHQHALARGADPARLLAELAGRATGYCGGRGGSMHISAPEAGFVTATGVVGGNIPLALGAALALSSSSPGSLAVCFFGDGAGQGGAFHESLNLAALWRLPVLFVCENNGFAEFTPLSAHTPVERLARHAETYGIPASTVDGGDLEAVRASVAAARATGGPAFVECLTRRLGGHYEGDPARYRKVSEAAEWKVRDPIRRFAASVPAEDAAAAEASARALVEAAAEAALAAPWPSDASVSAGVFA